MELVTQVFPLSMLQHQFHSEHRNSKMVRDSLQARCHGQKLEARKKGLLIAIALIHSDQCHATHSGLRLETHLVSHWVLHWARHSVRYCVWEKLSTEG
jgi:hypothetical protein